MIFKSSNPAVDAEPREYVSILWIPDTDGWKKSEEIGSSSTSFRSIVVILFTSQTSHPDTESKAQNLFVCLRLAVTKRIANTSWYLRQGFYQGWSPTASGLGFCLLTFRRLSVLREEYICHSLNLSFWSIIFAGFPVFGPYSDKTDPHKLRQRWWFLL